MNQSIALGPLALPVAPLVALGCVCLGWLAGMLAVRHQKLDIDAQLALVLLAGLLGARSMFVLQAIDAYRTAPLSILDPRDGGWDALGGFIAAGAAALLLALRQRALAWPLSAALATSACVWAAAALLPGALQERTPQLPQLSLSALDGREVALASFRGKPVVVNLWATWCPPCIREMPVLQQAQQERTDVEFVFVNQREPAGRVISFLGARGLGLRNVLLDAQGQLAGELGAAALPTTLFFDSQGRLAGARVGELSSGSLAARLSSIAPRPAAAP
ncbi:TlpA family protein disulfide reductase [Ramlibacter sp. AN1133]|uniref:TlpA family protein disulfide reductase n=1 Tax=Ramlibacter sp. AN1133 TaxID=3133429 RepID=UPI0030C2CC20